MNQYIHTIGHIIYHYTPTKIYYLLKYTPFQGLAMLQYYTFPTKLTKFQPAIFIWGQVGVS